MDITRECLIMLCLSKETTEKQFPDTGLSKCSWYNNQHIPILFHISDFVENALVVDFPVKVSWRTRAPRVAGHIHQVSRVVPDWRRELVNKYILNFLIVQVRWYELVIEYIFEFQSGPCAKLTSTYCQLFHCDMALVLPPSPAENYSAIISKNYRFY